MYVREGGDIQIFSLSVQLDIIDKAHNKARYLIEYIKRFQS